MLRHALRSRLMFLIFSVGVLGSSASSAETRHAFGTVVSVEGAVYYVSPSLLRPTRLNGGEGITSTSVLQTQPHSSVRILFHTAVLTVGEDTLVEIAPSSEGAVQNGTLVISLSRGVVRIVADGSPERSIRVQLADLSDTVHFSQGSVVMWAGESLSRTPDGRPMVSDMISSTGVANLGERAVLCVSRGVSMAVPGGSVLTRPHRPTLTDGGRAAAAPWIAKTDARWSANLETAKQTLQNLPNDHRLLPRPEARRLPHRDDSPLHTPPAVVSGVVTVPQHGAVVAAAPVPSLPPFTAPAANTPTGSSTSVTPVPVAPPGIIAPIAPASTSVLSGSGLPSFPDVIGALGNGNGNGQGRGRR
jgi:hypothetical protein